MQWRKLFDQNPVFSTLCDKLAVRDFISARAGDEFLIPLLWSGGPDEIPFDELTPPYVLKSNHASGQVMMVDSNMEIGRDAIRAQAAGWLASAYGTDLGESAYASVPRRLMIEQKLITEDGAAPEECKLFVFGGRVGVINSVFTEDGALRNGAFHTPDWTRLDWYFTRFVDRAFPRPERLRDMIETAERIGAGFDHLRVDFYDCGKRIWIGEVTVYAWSGLSKFNADAADLGLGAMWKLRAPALRALAAMALRRR